MSKNDYTLVRYVRNAEETSATQEVAFNDDDRPALKIGHGGYVTQAELYRLGNFGIVLETIDEDGLNQLGLPIPVHPDQAEDEESEVLSADLGKARLEEIAEAEGVDLSGARSNQAKADAIQAHRDVQTDGANSLPATATSTPGSTISSGEGAAGAGPDGAGPSGDAGALGSSTSTSGSAS